VINNLNQYSSASGSALSYNTNGNLTAYKGWTYGYDAHNRLTTASKTGTSVALGYDPGGNLISNTLGSVLTKYVYSGDQLIGEYTSAGAPINLYIYPPNSDIPIARFSGSSGLTDVKYLQSDERGSIVAETVGTTAVESHQYDVYGVPLNTSNSLFRYTGQIQLKGTELYHYKARAYHPGLGRFLQTDPIGYDDGMNMYAYVGNDPVNAADPTGLYGQGSGWSDKGWKKFDKIQQKAATRMEKRADKLEARADKLDAKGKDGGGDLRSSAGHLRNGASALRSDGSDGKIANAVDGATYQSMGGSAGGAAMVIGNAPVVTVNIDNDAAWSSGGSAAQRAIGHESLHTAGLNDKRAPNGVRAYQYGTPAQREAYQTMKGTRDALINPDHIMNSVY